MMLVKFQTNSRGRQMPLTITDASMTSDLTTHTAKPWPWNGEPAWSVTWLPGRVLTHNQAITAMTIAETVAAHADNLADRGPWQLHVDGWAAELGITGPIAIAEAIKPFCLRNHLGEVCPSWCDQDHDELLVPGSAESGYMDAHLSKFIWESSVHAKSVRVRIVQLQGWDTPKIGIEDEYHAAHLDLSAKEARALAIILGERPDGLAADILAAVQVLADVSVRAQK